MASKEFAIKELDIVLKSYRDTLTQMMDNYEKELDENGISTKLPRRLMAFPDEKLDTITLQEINEIIEDSGSEESCLKAMFFENKEGFDTYLDFSRNKLKELKNRISELIEIDNSIENAERDKEKLIMEYMEKLSSPEYLDAEIKFIEKVNSLSENSNIPPDMKKEIEITRRAHNLQFLFDRLDKYGATEADNIATTYFNKEKGSYVMGRYRKVMSTLNVNPAVYRNFTNFEEKLVPEMYYPLNNLFLFHIIRTIAYFDMDNEEEKRYTISILSMLAKYSEGKISEDQLRTLRSAVLRFYEFYSEEKTLEQFKERNSLYKYHPDRIEIEKMYEESRREKMIEFIKNELGDEYSDDILNDKTPDEVMKYIIDERARLTDEIISMCSSDDHEWVNTAKSLETFADVKEYYNYLIKVNSENNEEENIDGSECETDGDNESVDSDESE